MNRRAESEKHTKWVLSEAKPLPLLDVLHKEGLTHTSKSITYKEYRVNDPIQLELYNKSSKPLVPAIQPFSARSLYALLTDSESKPKSISPHFGLTQLPGSQSVPCFLHPPTVERLVHDVRQAQAAALPPFLPSKAAALQFRASKNPEIVQDGHSIGNFIDLLDFLGAPPQPKETQAASGPFRASAATAGPAEAETSEWLRIFRAKHGAKAGPAGNGMQLTLITRHCDVVKYFVE